MRQLPIERAVTQPDECREWNPVPCQRCRRVRTYHVTAICAGCRVDTAAHQTRVDRARNLHPGDWSNRRLTTETAT